MMLDGKSLHFWVADLDCFVVGFVNGRGLHGETGCGFGVADTSKHEIDRGQGCAGPGFGNLAEEAMLDGVPFGSTRRIVTDGHGQVKGIRQFGLELLFKKTRAIAIAAAAVGNGIDGKLSRIGGMTDVDVTLLVSLIIDAIGPRARQGIVGKIVHIDLGSLLTPKLSSLIEGANQLLFLGVNADDGPACQSEGLALALQIEELGITRWMVFGCQAFDIAFASDLGLIQPATNRLSAQAMPLIPQGTLQTAQTAHNPAPTVDRVPCHFIAHQIHEPFLGYRLFFSHAGRPAPGSRTRPCSRFAKSSASSWRPRRMVFSSSPLLCATSWMPPCP